MEFIEAMINPNFLCKRALKEVWKKSPNNEGKPHIKGPKTVKPQNPR